MARLELKIRELSEEWFSDLGRATIYRAPVVGAIGGDLDAPLPAFYEVAPT